MRDEGLRLFIHETGWDMELVAQELKDLFVSDAQQRKGRFESIDGLMFYVDKEKEITSGYLIEAKVVDESEAKLTLDYFSPYEMRDNPTPSVAICRDLDALQAPPVPPSPPKPASEPITQASCFQELYGDSGLTPGTEGYERQKDYLFSECQRQPEAAVCNHRKAKDYRVGMPEDTPISLPQLEEWALECGLVTD